MADVTEELLSEPETDVELLENAFKDEPEKEQPEKAEPEAKVEDNRDEKTGQFKAKETPETKVDPKAEQPKEAEDGAQVPSWRLREVAEEKRAAEARAQTLEGQLAALNARLSALDKPKEQPKQEDIDPLLDPQGFAKRIETSFEQRLQEERLNNNLALAHVRHGEKFEKAYGALLEQARAGNRQLVPQLTSQANPGEAIVKWYSDQETLKVVGGDPANYKNKVLEDALKDPEFLAKAIEAANASAGKPKTNTITRLPPSLSRATGSSANDDTEDGDISAEALLGR